MGVPRSRSRVFSLAAYAAVAAAAASVCSCGAPARTRVEPASSRAGHSVDDTRPRSVEESGSKIVVTLPPVVSKQPDGKKGAPR